MHWLQVFLLGWLSFGIGTVVFMFWLCKRTAATVGDNAGKEAVKLGSFSPRRAEFATSNLSGEVRSA
jgi:hypothetical protein